MWGIQRSQQAIRSYSKCHILSTKPREADTQQFVTTDFYSRQGTYMYEETLAGAIMTNLLISTFCELSVRKQIVDM
jgi:hypothetical protein